MKKGIFVPISYKDFAVLLHTVPAYLASHKRLVIPQLGTFIVKEQGVSVVFSELLRRDDGVLRGLLREQGLSELEAAALIDRFVFELRHTIAQGDTYRIDALGVFRQGPNATIAFVYDPVSTETDGSEDMASEKVTSETDGTEKLGPETTMPDAEKNASVFPEVGYDVSEPEPLRSPSVKLNPDPSVRGLRYGKPPKNTNTYSYVDRPKRRRRSDRFIWIALVAIALAVAVILFGYYVREERARLEEQYTDEPAASPQGANPEPQQPASNP